MSLLYLSAALFHPKLPQVADAFKISFHVSSDQLTNRKIRENYRIYCTLLPKENSSLNVRNEDYLKLAVEDFGKLESIHDEELESLERWFTNNRLDKLKFARPVKLYCYYTALSTISSPDLFDARLAFTKNSVLAIAVDDFFDGGGSMEELENLSQLIQRWNIDVAIDCCSDEVEIIFSAIYNTSRELAAKAITVQGRDVSSHLMILWSDLVNSMFKEAKWAKYKHIPTVDEYLENGRVTFTLDASLVPALYFIGTTLSEAVVQSSEYQKLSQLTGCIGRLLDDIVSFERETEADQVNMVSLLMFHGSKRMSKTEASDKIKVIVATKRRELLELLMQKEERVVPQACKEVWWKMNKYLDAHYNYKDL